MEAVQTQPQSRIPSLRAQTTAGQILGYIILLGGGLFMTLPFFWLVSSSLKTPGNIYVFPPQWIPNPARWSNYIETFQILPVMSYLRNTLIVVLFGTIGNVTSSTLAGYSFARLRFKGRDQIFAILLATLMLPYAVTMIPIYVMFTKVKFVGTLLPLIVPTFFGGSYSIFLLRQFFRTIPVELEDAALIDGASRPRIFLQIAAPLARPAIVVVMIDTILHHWNDFLTPLIYLTKKSLWTLALGLNALQRSGSDAGRDWTHYMMVVATLMVVPVIVIYFFAQRAFIQGIVLTGLKA